MTTALEDRLRTALQAKAAQLEPCEQQLAMSPTRWRRRSMVWMLAAAAAVVVVVAAVVVVERDDTVTSDELPPTPVPPADPFDEIVGFLPTDGIPAGWIMSRATFTWTPELPGGPVTQMFAPPGATVPYNLGVVVTSRHALERPPYVKDGEGWPPTPTLLPGSPGADQTSVPASATVSLPALSDPNAAVRGVPARVVTGPEEGLPDGTVVVSWLSGVVLHSANSVGMNAEETLSFLESLVARDDPATGFDAPPSDVLVELASEYGYAERRDFYAQFEPPGTAPGSPVPSISLMVSKGADDLHRGFEASVDEDGDVVIRQDLPEQAHRSVFELRSDGWTVGVSTNGTDMTMESVDAIRRSVVPVTGRQLLDDASALPSLDEVGVAGQPVVTRGVGGRVRAICLGMGDSQQCGLASEDPSGDHVAWILTDDGWLVVAIGTANTNVEIWGPGDNDDFVPPATRATAAGREWMIADVPEDAWRVIVSPSSTAAAWMRPIPPASPSAPTASHPPSSASATGVPPVSTSANSIPPGAAPLDAVRQMPPVPLEVRGDAAVVWTGSELVVWGGDVEAANMGLPGPDGAFNDGAALDPVSQQWRALAPSPLPAVAEFTAAAMTENGLVIARDRAVAVWDGADNSWRSVDDAPAKVTDLTAVGSVVVSYSANAALDVVTGEWRQLPSPPLRFERPTVAGTGSEVVVIGGPGTPFTSAAAIAFDLTSGTWRRLADPPSELRAEALSADWDGERVVVVNYDMRAASYDPLTDRWTTLPSVPARFYEWYPTVRNAGENTVAFMAQAAVVLTKEDRWLPLPTWAIGWGSVVSTRPAAGAPTDAADLIIWSFEDGANIIAMVDVDGLVAQARRLQVGVVSVEVPAGYEFSASGYDGGDISGETVTIELRALSGDACSVSADHARASGISQPLEEILESDGQPTTWFRNSEGTIWQNDANTSDVVTIECGDPEVAAALARSVSYT